MVGRWGKGKACLPPLGGKEIQLDSTSWLTYLPYFIPLPGSSLRCHGKPGEQEPGAGVRETSLLAGTALPSSLWGAGEGAIENILPPPPCPC